MLIFRVLMDYKYYFFKLNESMLTWDFNHQTGILETKYIGNIYLQEVVDYIRATKENKDLPRNLKILTTNSNNRSCKSFFI